MIQVADKILIPAGRSNDFITQILKLDAAKVGTVNAIKFWNDNFSLLKKMAPGLSSLDIDGINDLFFEWVDAPVFLGEDEKKSSYEFFSVAGKDTGVFKSVLQNTQRKFFPRAAHLFSALVGNYFAERSRLQDDMIARHVLSDFPGVENLFINRLMESCHEIFLSSKEKEPKISLYGDGAKINWGVKDILNQMSGEVVERLYKKIAFLHDVSHVCGTGKRPEKESVRLGRDKYSLNEEHPEVRSYREAGVSIWAGASGSTADMILMAHQAGLVDLPSLRSLCYVIGTFFHYMPTIRSSTHTFAEVFQGANLVFAQLGLDLSLPFDTIGLKAGAPVFKPAKL